MLGIILILIFVVVVIVLTLISLEDILHNGSVTFGGSLKQTHVRVSDPELTILLEEILVSVFSETGERLIVKDDILDDVSGHRLDVELVASRYRFIVKILSTVH